MIDEAGGKSIKQVKQYIICLRVIMGY